MDIVLGILTAFMMLLMNFWPVVLLIIGLAAGQITERRHFQELEEREEELRGVLTTNLKRHALNREVLDARLVSGHVVISTDYFKSLCATIRRLIGGRILSYERLVDRGRREALLRLKEEARKLQADLVMNVRFETMTIARSRQGKGVTGVEVLAYGTAIKAAPPLEAATEA